MSHLCILCCYAYQPPDNFSFGDGVLEENPTFRRFCEELFTDADHLINRLSSSSVLVCGECLSVIDKAMGVRRELGEVEKQVRSLQTLLLGKMRELTGRVVEWQRELGKVGEIVKRSNVEVLKGRMKVPHTGRTRRRKAGEEQDDEVLRFRGKIGEVAKEVDQFGRELEGKFVPSTQSADVSVSETPLLVAEVKEEIQDPPFDAQEWHDDDERKTEALESSEPPPTPPPAEDKPPVKKFPRSGKQSKEIAQAFHNFLSSQPQSSGWSLFKKRLLRRIWWRHNGNFTSTTDYFSYDPTTNKFTIRDVEILVQENPNHLQCSLCSQSFIPTSTSAQAQTVMDRATVTHVLGRHLSAFRCLRCDKNLLSARSFREHLQMHEGVYKCPICGKPCGTPDTLRRHQWLHLNAQEKEAALQKRRPIKKQAAVEETHVCGKCGKILGTAQILRQHSRTHEPQRQTTVCPLCGKEMLARSYRVYHRHNCPQLPVSQERVHCLKCNTPFKTRALLRRHQQRCKYNQDSEERKWPCGKCGKGFRTKMDVQIHEKIHGGEEIWTCGREECGKTFHVKRYWSRHEKLCKGNSVKEGT